MYSLAIIVVLIGIFLLIYAIVKPAPAAVIVGTVAVSLGVILQLILTSGPTVGFH